VNLKADDRTSGLYQRFRERFLSQSCTGGPSVAAPFIETLLAQEGAATEGPPVQDYHILRYIPLVAELAKITLIHRWSGYSFNFDLLI
jgi:hypothetical protein